jgi:D-amino-acid oxidase
MRVVVTGSGVIGLTTAVCLVESGFSVRIRTAALPQETTSRVAGAMWGSTFAGRRTRWRRERWPRCTRSASSLGSRAPAWRSRRACWRHAAARRRRRSSSPGWRCGPAIRRTHSALCSGSPSRSWICPDTSSISRDGWRRPESRSNCGRLTLWPRRREMVPRSSTAPASGRATWCPTARCGRCAASTWSWRTRASRTSSTEPFGPAWTSWMPRGDRIVLGSVAQEDDWDLEPRAADAERILEGCAALEPRFPRRTRHRAPGRPQARPRRGARRSRVAGRGARGTQLRPRRQGRRPVLETRARGGGARRGLIAAPPGRGTALTQGDAGGVSAAAPAWRRRKPRRVPQPWDARTGRGG